MSHCALEIDSHQDDLKSPDVKNCAEAIYWLCSYHYVSASISCAAGLDDTSGIHWLVTKLARTLVCDMYFFII